MKFLYLAKSKDGVTKKGEVIAPSKAKAEQLLLESGFAIVSLQEQQQKFFDKVNIFAGNVDRKELVLFTRQLATLISARVPILQSLRVLQSQVSNERLQFVLADLISAVENGESLSFAMSKHPKVFSGLYVSLVRSGEASGSLNKSLIYIADQVEKDYELRSKIKGALTYPIFVVAILLIVIGLMMKFVLPKLTEVLKSNGTDLPFVSKLLIRISDGVAVYWWLILLVIFGLVAAFRFFIASESGREQWDSAKLNIPVVGSISEQIYLARFSRNLATLSTGGLPIIQSLKIISETIGNTLYRDLILEAATNIANGKSLSDSLAQHEEFPPIVTQMVRVGEQTAQLDEILNKLAVFYEKEVEAKVSTITTLLEPIIIIILGAGVMFLIAAVLFPIYNIANTIQ